MSAGGWCRDLLDAGYHVRCLVRDPGRLQGRPWLKRVEVVTGDALSKGPLMDAMQDVSAAYYLIHGKQGGQISANRDLEVARNFAEAARDANIERIIYLGELVDPTADLSPTCAHVMRQATPCATVPCR